MARRARLAVPGCRHYVWQRSVHGQALVADDADRAVLLEAIRQGAADTGILVEAYALLDNEIHLLATPPDAGALGQLMQRVGRRYVSAHNRRHRRQGALWAGRFASSVVESGEWALAIMLLIDRLGGPHPIRGSAAHHAGRERTGWLADTPELWQLGNTPFERELAYRQRLAEETPPDRRDRVLAALRGSWPIGSGAFVDETEHRLGRPLRPRRPGRPRRAPSD